MGIFRGPQAAGEPHADGAGLQGRFLFVPQPQGPAPPAKAAAGASAIFSSWPFSSAIVTCKAALAVDDIQELLLADRLPEAEQPAAAPWLIPDFSARKYPRIAGLGTSFLKAGWKKPAAQFQSCSRTKVSTSLHSGELLKYFFDRGDYCRLKIYTDYLLPRGGDEARWFYALGQAALLESRRIGKSPGRAFARIPQGQRQGPGGPGPSSTAPCAWVGSITYSTGMTGLWRISISGAESPVPCSRAWTWVISTRSSKKASARFRLTLDCGAAKESRSPVPGVISAPWCSWTCRKAASPSPIPSPGPMRPPTPPLSEQFEPGSVIKIVTLLAYLRHAARRACSPWSARDGSTIGGKVFYDRIVHGQVRDFTQALAVSCNVSFARMGCWPGLRAPWPTCCSALISMARPSRTGF